MATILVVEDNEELRTILRDLLSAEHDVHTASRGDEGVEAARRVRPELVIMDLQLPVMSGIEAGRRIKDEAPDLPVLALTAMAQPGDQVEVLESGCCDGYLTKPASLEEIRRKVAELLD